MQRIVGISVAEKALVGLIVGLLSLSGLAAAQPDPASGESSVSGDTRALDVYVDRLAAVAAEQTAVQPSAAPPAEPPVETEETLVSKLSVHGFLTLAWGRTDGNQILGLTEGGTADYRSAALQLRFAPTGKDAFVAQFANERIADSPITQYLEDAEIDWLFYERRLGEATSLRAGKVPIPMGIYNEIRDVGTLLPFYRPPHDVYGETSFASETVDGVLVSHRFRRDSDWRVSLDGYVGEWRLVEYSTPELHGEARVHDAAGFQTWIYTPVRNLRLGLAGQRGSVSGGPNRAPGIRDPFRTYQGSIDYSAGRLSVRGEIWRAEFKRADYTGAYLELGGRLTRKVSLHALAQTGNLDLSTVRFDREIDRDYALGAEYAFHSGLALKAELHWNRGFRSEDPVPRFDPILTRYGLVSLSYTF